MQGKLSDSLRPKIWVAEQMNNLANILSLGLNSLSIVAMDMHSKMNAKLNALRMEAEKMDKTILTDIPLKDRFEPSDAYLSNVCDQAVAVTVDQIVDRVLKSMEEEDDAEDYDSDSDL